MSADQAQSTAEDVGGPNVRGSQINLTEKNSGTKLQKKIPCWQDIEKALLQTLFFDPIIILGKKGGQSHKLIAFTLLSLATLLAPYLKSTDLFGCLLPVYISGDSLLSEASHNSRMA